MGKSSKKTKKQTKRDPSMVENESSSASTEGSKAKKGSMKDSLKRVPSYLAKKIGGKAKGDGSAFGIYLIWDSSRKPQDSAKSSFDGRDWTD